MSSEKQRDSEKFTGNITYRYGIYQVLYEDREKNVNFINMLTKESFLMDPRDIALSQDLIQEFDAVQAFYIGFIAGLKLNNPTIKRKNDFSQYNPPTLKLVKK